MAFLQRRAEPLTRNVLAPRFVDSRESLVRFGALPFERVTGHRTALEKVHSRIGRGMLEEIGRARCTFTRIRCLLSRSLAQKLDSRTRKLAN